MSSWKLVEAIAETPTSSYADNNGKIIQKVSKDGNKGIFIYGSLKYLEFVY